MIELNITGENTYASDHLDQYDYGQKLRMHGDIQSPVEVQFSLQKSGGEAPRMLGVEVDGAIEADIPDEMLRNNGTMHDYNIYAFVYVRDETSGETTHRIIIPVKSRPKPGDYIPPEHKDYGELLLANIQNETKKAIDAKETASMIAETVAEDAKQVADDKKFVEQNASQIQENKNKIEEINRKVENHLTNHPSGGSGSGSDGITPHIGENGNWFIGEHDTGTRAEGRDGYTPQKGVDYFDGEPGADGKSAYEYAQDGGYTGTEEEFRKMLSEDVPKISELKGDIASKLTKPETAQVGQIFRVQSINEDGTYVLEAVDMPICSSVDSDQDYWKEKEVDFEITLEEAVGVVEISEINGQPFSFEEVRIFVTVPGRDNNTFVYIARNTSESIKVSSGVITANSIGKVAFHIFKDLGKWTYTLKQSNGTTPSYWHTNGDHIYKSNVLSEGAGIGAPEISFGETITSISISCNLQPGAKIRIWGKPSKKGLTA